ncbi:MAG: phosphatidate cytidylyltransferase [Salaquimonas sp.]
MPEIKNKKTGQYSELPLRIASAIVLAAFAIFCTWMGGDTFRLLAMFLSILIFVEFRGMIRSHLPFPIGVFAGLLLLILFGSYFVGRPFSGLAIIAAGAVLLALWEVVVRRSIWGAVLLLYSAIPFAALVDMREGEAGFFIILFVFACVWGADTFAYFSGKTFGGPKLAPAISPNKTWSGFFGGFAGAIIVSTLVDVWFGFPIGIFAILLAVALAFFSQIGDLFESWVKRRFGLKDSGKLIPGHGGILDRIDGLIFAIAGAWVISLLFAPQAFEAKTLPKALIQAIF